MNTRRPGRPRGAGVFDDDELLDLALDALARGGYRSLSMRGIARELGVSLASVQNRHATKDELWRAAVDRLFDDVQIAVVDAPFVDAVRRRLSVLADRPRLLFALLTDDEPGSEERIAYVAQRIEPAVRSARETFAAASDTGLIRPIDIDVFVAVMLVVPGALAALPAPIGELLRLGPEPHDRLAAGFADVAMLGLVAREGD